ncbi:AAA family ATPase [Clostridium aestuarii]|uniref:endopeptidase La n=1 Tax=Clostridium aestuarii TaxID=338193 RepID=A0ABT4CXI5_9CLOT|nr:AAA family ATPase [Clostridium aestuarii]MCY6483709.1 AAA family ATPase [Clostridium aestuarii]
MNMELSSRDVTYKFNIEGIDLEKYKDNLPEYTEEVYDKIKTALEIYEEGFNVYLIDDFSKNKLANIEKFINNIFENRDKPKDICYVIKDDVEKPVSLILSNGKGKILKQSVIELQDTYYNVIYDFYNNSVNKEKDEIIENIQKKRTELITELMQNANSKGFEIRYASKGFTFIPLKEEGVMTEKEYDDLDADKKEELLNKVSELKNKSQDILKILKNIEISEIEKIQNILIKYLKDEVENFKKKYKEEFICDSNAVEFLTEMCNEIEKEIVENYSMVYEDDEAGINEIIMKYDVNVLVDNSEFLRPRVIFEEDPSVNNLLGSIEYKNQNGNYVTDCSLIKGGSLLKANEGCIIIRANSLLSNPSTYYNLKKTIMNEKVDFDHNKGYVELLSLSSLNPEPIRSKVKVILIGDYQIYDLLYNYDEDFKKIFKIKAQYKPVVDINESTKAALVNEILEICNDKKLKSLNKEAIKEVAKFLSRKAENKNKLFFNDEELSKILMLSNNKVVSENRDNITIKDIIDIANDEDLIEKEIRNYYKDGKILLNVTDKKIGQINALSVIDSGYFSFGKPIRITCSCYKGGGDIIDVQKQSDMSGNIHDKAVNTLRGVINGCFGKYSKLPVNFHLSFEQIYGKVDGDSASVAEFICMISALSNIPIKQNIAVTGSINQFGEVQPVGGINEKIEGFFKTCKCIDTIENKGVLIPFSNKDNLILSYEIEKAIGEGKFHIYTMKDVRNAVETLMGEYKKVFSTAKKEIRKYSKILL